MSKMTEAKLQEFVQGLSDEEFLLLNTVLKKDGERRKLVPKKPFRGVIAAR